MNLRRPRTKHYRQCKAEFDAMIDIALRGGTVGEMHVHADKLMKMLLEERTKNAKSKGTESSIHRAC